MNIFNKIRENILFIFTLFLLAFIPLYPKLPLLDIRNTWVYVRIEDFVVIFVLIIWLVYLVKKRIGLKTPLTIPILVFWLVGALATIHGVLLIFPTIANVFTNVAFLSFVRRIEYLSLFFVAFSAIRKKKHLHYIIGVLAITLILVVAYGIGQRYLGFPAFLTMNEEFAKGEPIVLSRQSRVPSTFAGHYDLAAYIVLVLPIFASLIFGTKNWIAKIFFAGLVASGFLLMFMTVSRVSFIVLIISLCILLLFQRKRIIIFAIPLIITIPILFLSFAPSLLNRFGSTINEVDVLINATTGQPIGHAKLVKAEYFKDKVIVHDFVLEGRRGEGDSVFIPNEKIIQKNSAVFATTSANLSTKSAGRVPYYDLPSEVTLLIPENVSTGENLPQGTGYINLSLSPVNRKIGGYLYEKKEGDKNIDADVIIKNGNFLVKKAAAYDLSFTTRFQGEWPHAIEAFTRNIFLGSGYGSISLAIDNNYLRILGEIGVLGAASFLTIFLVVGIYIKKVLPNVDSPITRSFIIGFSVGVLGLGLNAVFIDVFEASKIAFVLWLLTGCALGLLRLYQKSDLNIYLEIKKAAYSTPAVVVYLLLLSLFLYTQMLNNYFVGDDFTWFRWVAENNNLLRFFTNSDGFFYRPGTKLYFSLMYKTFWLNQTIYHAVSLFSHFLVTVLVFITAKKILRSVVYSLLAAFLFLFMSGTTEAVFWISSTGFLITTIFTLLSLLMYLTWLEKKKMYLFILILLFISIGLLFHELGVVVPVILLAFRFIHEGKISFNKNSTLFSSILFIPVVLYGVIRYTANSHWFGGDYNYNLIKLPFNALGNLLGYGLNNLFGPLAYPAYQVIRELFKQHIYLSLGLTMLGVIILFFVTRKLIQVTNNESRKVLLQSAAIFIIGLLPFLGLGNMTSRYSYLSSVGFVIVVSYFIKKFYEFLVSQGKDIALVSVLVIMAFIILLHLMQIQQIQNDWKTAGQITERFLISMDEASSDYWRYDPMTLYFINTPIRTGEAWVFPVGMNDALWFSFRNPKIIIKNAMSVDESLNLVTNPWNEKVFEFEANGKITEHKKKLFYQ